MIGPRRVNKPLVLYGYGKLGHLAEEVFHELKIPIHVVFDQKARPPLIPDRCKEKALLAVCIASEPYQPIHDSLKADGWTDIVPVWDVIEVYPEVGLRNGWFTGDITEEDARGYSFVMDHFHGKLSKDHYSEFVIWHVNRTSTDSVLLQIKPLAESLPSTLADIRQRQHMQKYVLGVQGDVIIHNEGYELQTIQESLPVFQKDRPRFQVACYHSRDGFWKIQKTLMESLPDYSWTFRLHAYMGQAAYLYGQPKEKA